MTVLTFKWEMTVVRSEVGRKVGQQYRSIGSAKISEDDSEK